MVPPLHPCELGRQCPSWGNNSYYNVANSFLGRQNVGRLTLTAAEERSERRADALRFCTRSRTPSLPHPAWQRICRRSASRHRNTPGTLRLGRLGTQSVQRRRCHAERGNEKA